MLLESREIGSMYIRVEGIDIKLTNPDKELFLGITKWKYVQYLGLLAPFLLPYCQDRLLTTIRFPNGVTGKSFYQKHVPKPVPSFVKTVVFEEIEYILLQDTPTLIWLANLACLEFHVSFHKWQMKNEPTELVFDLDPTGSPFEQVREVALLTREVLLGMGLDGVVKTSGASGLQIYVPLKSGYTFEQTRQVNKFIARYLAEKHPQLITLERKVKDRGTKVYFDYLQHWRGKTLIAPYSPRATTKATISTPLLWEEVQQSIEPSDFTLSNILERIKQKGDLFATAYNASSYDLATVLSFIG